MTDDTLEMINLCLNCPKAKCNNCFEHIARTRKYPDLSAFDWEPPVIPQELRLEVGKIAELIISGYCKGLYDWEIAQPLGYSVSHIAVMRNKLGLKAMRAPLRAALRLKAGLQSAERNRA